MEIVQQLNGRQYPTLICLQGEVHAKTFQSLANAGGFPVQNRLSLGNLSEHSELKNLDISSGKMLRECCLQEAVGTLPTSLVLFPKVGIICGGKFSTPKILVSLKTESVSLSSVLETKIPKRYFLSEKIQQRLKLSEQPKEKKIHESEKETTYTPQMELWGGLKATDFKQPPQILVKNKGESQHYRLYDEEGLAPTLQSQSGMSSQKHPFIVASRGRNPENPKSRKSGLPTEQMFEPNTEGISNTLTSVEKDNYVFDGKVRKLMPIECERLMSWSDDWTKYGINEKGETIEISDSQRYKMCGNGVVSNVIKFLRKEFLVGDKLPHTL